jgi:hypothetical protein
MDSIGLASDMLARPDSGHDADHARCEDSHSGQGYSGGVL